MIHHDKMKVRSKLFFMNVLEDEQATSKIKKANKDPTKQAKRIQNHTTTASKSS